MAAVGKKTTILAPVAEEEGEEEGEEEESIPVASSTDVGDDVRCAARIWCRVGMNSEKVAETYVWRVFR